MKSNEIAKRLFVVATPIGNLADISQRALDCLRDVDLVLCENTDHSLKLLRHFGIKPKQLRKLTDHETEKDIEHYLNQCVKNGIALISDAGTPLMCDPGQKCVQMAHAAGFGVLAVPGPCAVIAALSICPFPAMPFRFYGFLQRKSNDRLQQLDAMKDSHEALVFYESPHRLIAMLQDCEKVFSTSRSVFVVKELTKRFECFWHGSLGEVRQTLSDEQLLGEFVVILAGSEPKSSLGDDEKIMFELDACIKSMLDNGLSAQTIKQILSPITPLKKNDLYKRILALKPHES